MHHHRKPSVLFWAGVAAAAAMVVGGLGPWAHLAWTHARSLSGRRTAAGLLLAGGLVAATAVYDLYDISAAADASEPAFLQDVLNPGWGIYLSLAAGVALAILALGVLAGEVMFDPVPAEPLGA